MKKEVSSEAPSRICREKTEEKYRLYFSIGKSFLIKSFLFFLLKEREKYFDQIVGS